MENKKKKENATKNPSYFVRVTFFLKHYEAMGQSLRPYVCHLKFFWEQEST